MLWVARAVLVVAIVALILQAYFLITPYNQYSSVKGYCHIQNIVWIQLPCPRRYAERTYYYAPWITGQFWEHMKPQPNDFEGLSVDKNHFNSHNSSYHYYGESTVFLFDDNTDDALVNCLTDTVITTKRKLVDYIPLYADYIDVESSTNHLPSLYPNKFIDCYFRNKIEVFLKSKRMTGWVVVPFVFTVFLIGGLTMYVVENGTENAEQFYFILMPIYMAMFVVHAILYVIFIGFIGSAIFDFEPRYGLEKSFEKGSVLLLVKWAYKKLKKLWIRCSGG